MLSDIFFAKNIIEVIIANEIKIITAVAIE